MKFELYQEHQVRVFDVPIPVKRTSVRHDLRLICRICRDEYDGALSSQAVSNICSMLGLSDNRWRVMNKIGDKEHGLWRGGKLTEAGLKCADDGLVLENEDGVHRCWVIDAPEPIGCRLLHSEAYEDLRIDKDNSSFERVPYEEFEGLRPKIRYHSIIDETLEMMLDPPGWWKRLMKGNPVIIEEKEHVSSVRISAIHSEGETEVIYQISGELKGIELKSGNRKYRQGVDATLSNALRFNNIPIIVERPMTPQILNDEIGNLLGRELKDGQYWDGPSLSILTTYDALESNESTAMVKSIDLPDFESSLIGSWDGCHLSDVNLKATNVDEARKWISELYWQNGEDEYHYRESLLKVINELNQLSAFSGINPSELSKSEPKDWLTASSESPPGAKWLLEALDDHVWAMEVKS